ncbi:MAG TPA: heliorhodopsin HeR [bacterium]|nr:heliorhodopsin HeR [bacterium]
METGDQFARLRRWNIFAAILHLVSGIAMVMLSTDMKVPVMTSFLKFNQVTQSLLPDQQVWFELPLGILIASFLFLSALAHLIIATVYNKKYNEGLEKGINKARWVEYSFSSSVMIVVISMLVGIYDAAALIPIILVNASMILFGWMMELHNQTTKKTDWTAFIFGCIAGIGPWIAIALYLASPGSDSNPPTFVYWIFFSLFVFFNIFAINQYLQYKKIGKWQDYIYGEKAYIILSFVAKSLLAWQVFAGTLRP